jgi:hypothetical protein
MARGHQAAHRPVKASWAAVDAHEMQKIRREPLSRCIVIVGLGVLTLWALWALLYETTGLPGLNYLSFGFVSLLLGAILFFASLVGYWRASAGGYPKSDALAAVIISVVTGLLPFIALLEFADYS